MFLRKISCIQFSSKLIYTHYILNTIINNYDPTATVLISTHLIADVEPVLDAFLFLHQGRLVCSGSVDEVREKDGKTLDELFREVFRCLPNC